MPGQEGGDPAGIVDAVVVADHQLAYTRGNRCRWVSSAAHTTARRGTPRSGGPNDGHHPVILGVTPVQQLGPPPDRDLPHPPIQRAQTRLRPPPIPPQPRHGPRPGTGRQRGDPLTRSAPAQPKSPAAGPVGRPGHPVESVKERCAELVEPGRKRAPSRTPRRWRAMRHSDAQLARYSNRAVLHIPASPRRTSTRLCPYGRSSRADPASRARCGDHVSPVRDHFCAQSPPTPSERFGEVGFVSGHRGGLGGPAMPKLLRVEPTPVQRDELRARLPAREGAVAHPAAAGVCALIAKTA